MTQYRDAEKTSGSRPAASGFSYPWDDPRDSEKTKTDAPPRTEDADPAITGQQNPIQTKPDGDPLPPNDVNSFNTQTAQDDGDGLGQGLDEVRRAVDEAIRERYDGTAQSYQLWFERLRLKTLTADRAVFVCENSLKLKIIAERFRDLLSNALEEVLGYRPRLMLDVDPALAPELSGGMRIGPAQTHLPRAAETETAAGSDGDGSGETAADRYDDEGWNAGADSSSSMAGNGETGGFSRVRRRDGTEGRIDTAGRLSWDGPATDTDADAVAGSEETRQGRGPSSSFLPGDRPGFRPDPDGESLPFSPSRPAPPIRFSDEDGGAAIRTDNPPDSYDKSGGNGSGSGGKRPVFHDGYTFDNFIVGSSNQMAHAAALSVADNVGWSINPLFIWGSAGLGKTHLMYAIANRAVERDPSLRVICVKGEEFMNEMIEAIRKDKNQAFRDKYRKTDMLLIDDIQFIAGKESTQTEFFHTFDALYEDRKQIIITSDRPPKDLTSLENRIRSRFEAGLLVDIQPPDYELRMAILRDKISQSGMEFPTEVIDFLAKNLKENIRQLEGVVKKLSMVHMVSGCPVTMELVLKTVPEYLRNTEPLADTVSRIIETAAAYYNVKADDILGKERKKNIQTARNVSMYLVRTVTGASYPQIGVFFYRDHSTVHSNIAKVEAEIADDAVFEANVDAILKEIRR